MVVRVYESPEVTKRMERIRGSRTRSEHAILATLATGFGVGLYYIYDYLGRPGPIPEYTTEEMNAPRMPPSIETFTAERETVDHGVAWVWVVALIMIGAAGCWVAIRVKDALCGAIGRIGAGAYGDIPPQYVIQPPTHGAYMMPPPATPTRPLSPYATSPSPAPTPYPSTPHTPIRAPSFAAEAGTPSRASWTGTPYPSNPGTPVNMGLGNNVGYGGQSPLYGNSSSSNFGNSPMTPAPVPFPSFRDLPTPVSSLTPQPPQFGVTTPATRPGLTSALGGLSLGGLGSSLSSGLAAMGLGGLGPNPSAPASRMRECDSVYQPTYSHFGVELEASVERFIALIGQMVADVQDQLNNSDAYWSGLLGRVGYMLVDAGPATLRTRPMATQRIISVYDRHLPAELVSQEPRLEALWADRQKLEAYLTCPGFGEDARQHVLARLKTWRSSGFASSYEPGYRTGLGPTDSHILENLIFRMLDHHTAFTQTFLVYPGHNRTAHSSVYLRQVEECAVEQRHYEVVTPHSLWKIRPGKRNLVEALAVFLTSMKDFAPKDFPRFPKAVQELAGKQKATGFY